MRADGSGFELLWKKRIGEWLWLSSVIRWRDGGAIRHLGITRAGKRFNGVHAEWCWRYFRWPKVKKYPNLSTMLLIGPLSIVVHWRDF